MPSLSAMSAIPILARASGSNEVYATGQPDEAHLPGKLLLRHEIPKYWPN